MSTLAISNSFSPNTLIKSSEVNQNFTDVLNWANGSVGTNNIAAANITTAMIANAAVTPVKGGLGIDLSGTAQGCLIYASATGVFTVLSPGTAGYILQTGGANANPSWIVKPVQVGLGAYTGQSYNTPTQVATDGFLFGDWFGSGPTATAEIRVDANNPPTTVQVILQTEGSSDGTCFCIPINKGNYFLITNTSGSGNISHMYFIPLGT